MTLAQLDTESLNALRAYAAKYGRTWKTRLTQQAWMYDWPEQWGLLRNIRNSCDDAFNLKALQKAVR